MQSLRMCSTTPYTLMMCKHAQIYIQSSPNIGSSISSDNIASTLDVRSPFYVIMHARMCHFPLDEKHMIYSYKYIC